MVARVSPALRMSLFFAAIFGAVGVYLPFWPVWLAGRGLGPAEIGLVTAASMFVRGLSTPLIGSMSDRVRERRAVMAVAAAVGFAATILFHLIDGFAAILLVAIVLTVGHGALTPLADNLAMLLARARQFDYGPVRALGSVAFVIASVGAGWALAGRSSETVLLLLMAMNGLNLLAVLLLPAAPPAPPSDRRGELAPLLRQPVILWLLAAVTLVQCSHAVYYGFGTLEWRRLGIGDDAIGLLWGAGVLGEIVLFWRGQSVLKRLDPVALMALSGAAGVLRWLLTPVATWLPALVAVQLLHALTFAACHLGMMMVLARAVPVSHSATAQGLMTAMSGAFGFSAAMAASGWLYAAFGANAYYFMAGLAALGITSALMVGRMWNGEPLTLGR